jgi:hypothetical protein
LKYILELGLTIGAVDKKFNKNKKNINDFFLLTQDTLKILGEKEKIINNLMKLKELKNMEIEN